MWVGGQRHAPGVLSPGKTRYPLYRRLGGPQGVSGWVRKISPPSGFDPRTVQPVTSRYTDWAVLARGACCTRHSALRSVGFTIILIFILCNSKAQVWCPATYCVPSIIRAWIIRYADYRFTIITCQWLMMEVRNDVIQRSYKILSSNKNHGLFTRTTSVSHEFNVFHPEVFDTYTINNNIQSNTTIIWYVIYWPWATCFDSIGIIIRPSLKNTDPLHRTIKTLHGIPNVHNKLVFIIRVHMSFDVSLTVHLSIFISVINQLDAQNFCFTISFISCLYMFRAHVLIIRRSKLHYTTSWYHHTYRCDDTSGCVYM